MSFLTALNYPKKIWDGSSRSRKADGGPIQGIDRRPDGDDYGQAMVEIIALQSQLGVAAQTLTPGATMSFDPAKGMTVSVSVSADGTINAVSAGLAGQICTFIIANDATIRTITFGTNFKASGTLAGTANKSATITFRSDGTNWYEQSRATGL